MAALERGEIDNDVQEIAERYSVDVR